MSEPAPIDLLTAAELASRRKLLRRDGSPNAGRAECPRSPAGRIGGFRREKGTLTGGSGGGEVTSP
jgi:hypothetical protein